MSERESNTQIKETLSSDTTTASVRGRLVDVSVSGTFDADWTIQRMVGKDGVWGDVVTYSGPQERVMENASPCSVRVKVSSYVSGSVVIKLSGDR